MPNDTLLCSDPRVTAESLSILVRDRDRATIATFIENRFIERYFTPIDALNAEQKNGFAIMALCCLTIEALQSFVKVWNRLIDRVGRLGKTANNCRFSKKFWAVDTIYQNV